MSVGMALPMARNWYVRAMGNWNQSGRVACGRRQQAVLLQMNEHQAAFIEMRYDCTAMSACSLLERLPLTLTKVFDCHTTRVAFSEVVQRCERFF